MFVIYFTKSLALFYEQAYDSNTSQQPVAAKPKQEKVLSDIKNTLKERGERYGKFRDHAIIAQGLQDEMRIYPGWQRLAPDQKQALTVIADKIARMLNGDPNYLDNWHDIIGYAKLVEDRLLEDQSL